MTTNLWILNVLCHLLAASVGVVGLAVVPQPPAYHEKDLLARAGVTSFPTATPLPRGATTRNLKRLDRRVTTTAETCGWTSADALRPMTCPIGLGCNYWYGSESSENVAVCCPHAQDGAWNWGDCPPPYTCVDYNSQSYSASSFLGLGELSITTDNSLLW